MYFKGHRMLCNKKHHKMVLWCMIDEHFYKITQLDARNSQQLLAALVLTFFLLDERSFLFFDLKQFWVFCIWWYYFAKYSLIIHRQNWKIMKKWKNYFIFTVCIPNALYKTTKDKKCNNSVLVDAGLEVHFFLGGESPYQDL